MSSRMLLIRLAVSAAGHREFIRHTVNLVTQQNSRTLANTCLFSKREPHWQLANSMGHRPGRFFSTEATTESGTAVAGHKGREGRARHRNSGSKRAGRLDNKQNLSEGPTGSGARKKDVDDIRKAYTVELSKFQQELMFHNLTMAWPMYVTLCKRNMLVSKDVVSFLEAVHQSIRAEATLIRQRDLDQGLSKSRNRDIDTLSFYLGFIFNNIKQDPELINAQGLVHLISCFKELGLYRHAIKVWEWACNNSPGNIMTGFPFSAIIEVYADICPKVEPAVPFKRDIPPERYGRAELMLICDRLFEDYKSLNTPPITLVYISMIYAKLRLSNVKGALEIWQECKLMCQLSDTHERKIYLLFIEHAKNADVAIRFFREAIEKEIDIPASTMKQFIRNMSTMGKSATVIMDFVKEYVESTKGNESKYLLCVIEFIKIFFKDYDYATIATMKLLNEILQMLYKVLPEGKVHTAIFNTIISRTADTWHRLDIVDEILKGMYASGVRPTIVTYRILMIAYSDDENYHSRISKCWQDIEELQASISPINERTVAVNIEHLFRATCRTGKWDFFFDRVQSTPIQELLVRIPSYRSKLERIYQLRERAAESTAY
ncbi:hypothetical protein V1511DRAFT_508704 [Dipodascopsis uninucleata]